MASCDDLWRQSAADSDYEAYGDTCAGRQQPDSGTWCDDAFVSDTTPTTTSLVVDTTRPIAAAPPTSSPDEPVEDNDHLFTIGTVTVPPGEPGQLDVVLTGPDDGSSVPMIVRNNTDGPLSDIEVTGIARDTAGTLVATGSSLGFEPYRLEPGDWAIGYVYFDIDVLGSGETFDFVPTGQQPDRQFDKVSLTVTEAVLQPGSFADRVVGIVVNETDAVVSGPNSVYVACFDGPFLLGVAESFTDVDEIAPGGIAPFTVDLYDIDTCPAMALAGSGWTF